MGSAKRMMEAREEAEQLAREFLVSIDVLEECEVHEVFYDPQMFPPDEDDITKAVNLAVSKGKLSVPDNMTQGQLIALMMDVISESGDECYICRDNFAKD